MPKKRKKTSVAKTVLLLLLALTGLGLVISVLLRGNNVALFNPKGAIAQQQLDLILMTTGILLIIAVPTLFILYFVAWKYRESNTKATHDPTARSGKWLDASIWLIPIGFAVVLSLIMWPATHRLEPKKTIAADAKPLTVQVVAMRWKWLFIYPEHNIATVNYVQMPVNTSVQFDLTGDEAPMSSFWIPNLGGMLYAMTGHTNRLNLIADTPGEYPGSSAEINGAGFAGMKFTASATSKDDFDKWVQEVKQYTSVLDTAEYDKLVQPSENNEVAFYSAAEPGLYDKILKKYMGAGHDHSPAPYKGGH